MADQPFLTDIQTLRARARQHIENGAMSPVTVLTEKRLSNS